MSGDPRPSSPPVVKPSVFVASLVDYVNGILHGRWVAVSTVDALSDTVLSVLAGSPWTAATGEPAEEWIILDHEGFTGIGPDAHEALADVVIMAEQIHPASSCEHSDLSPSTPTSVRNCNCQASPATRPKEVESKSN